MLVAVAAMPPKPNTAANIATIKNINAHLNMVPPILVVQIPRLVIVD